jgi:hypothetical protein
VPDDAVERQAMVEHLVEEDGADDNGNTFDEAVSKMKYKLMKSRRRPQAAGRHLYCRLLRP